MKYRAEIDGLRALAVVSVILFHAGFELFSGGFVGVDVFFVISGYLITTVLIEDIENKQFSIANFYERRARRILPALFFVMLVCIPFAWNWMLPSEMKNFSHSLVAVSLFAANILFWRESGYLITTILIEDIENKRFSIVNFYERRARRILPALFFVMLVCIPFAWMWMLPNQMKDFSHSLVAVSLFASNILFWRASG